MDKLERGKERRQRIEERKQRIEEVASFTFDIFKIYQNSRDSAFVSRIIFSSGISFSPGETVFLTGCSFRSLSNVEEVVEKNSFFHFSARIKRQRQKEREKEESKSRVDE